MLIKTKKVKKYYGVWVVLTVVFIPVAFALFAGLPDLNSGQKISLLNVIAFVVSAIIATFSFSLVINGFD